MSTIPRDYTPGTINALASLSGGFCYWPTCRVPIVTFEKDEPYRNVQTAHIRAISLKGPRYSPNIAEPNSFSNLLLLCTPHHLIVDKIRPADFTADELLKWKEDRESDNKANLAGLGQVTEARLQDLLAAAIGQRDQEVKEAVDRLAGLNAQAAKRLQGLLDELRQRRHHYVPDTDAVDLLSQAADQLRHLPNTTDILVHVTNDLARLSNLQDTVLALSEMSNLPDAINQAAMRLEAAATRLEDLGGMM